MINEFVIKPAVTALRTLTVIPMPGQDTRVFGRSLLYFTLSGAVLGGLCCGLLFLLKTYAPFDDMLSTAFVLLFSVFITGALHIDGLADTFDGFGGGKTAEKALEIMKDPRQGTFGVAAIVFDLLLKWLLMRPIIETENYTLLVMLFIVSRSVQPLLLSFFPYARKGFGTAAPFCEGGKVYSLLSVAASLIISGYLLKLNGIFAMVLAIIVVLLWGLYCRRCIGGITGDCIGAGNEFTEIALLILFCWGNS